MPNLQLIKAAEMSPLQKMWAVNCQIGPSLQLD